MPASTIVTTSPEAIQGMRFQPRKPFSPDATAPSNACGLTSISLTSALS
jgi:hypothetical protein